MTHWEVVGQARLQPRTPHRVVALSDSDGSLQQDDRHHRRSRSCSPVSPGCAGKTLAERQERQLAEATVPVRPPTGPPQAGPSYHEPPAPETVPAGEAAPAAKAVAPAAPPAGGTLDTLPDRSHGAAADAPADHGAAPGTPLARANGPAQA